MMVIFGIQVLISLVIMNVWLVRRNRATSFRGGDATTMREEFLAYGLPAWSVNVIMVLKIGCAAALLFGLWMPEISWFAAIGLALLMLGAVTMHLKIRDSFIKVAPALSMFILCMVVILYG